MRNPIFTLEYWLDEGWYVGRLREVPGVFSQGKTLEELEIAVRDAYNLMLEEYASVELPAVRSTKTLELSI
jgi:predicted RNase H-like HicB family nuclease